MSLDTSRDFSRDFSRNTSKTPLGVPPETSALKQKPKLGIISRQGMVGYDGIKKKPYFGVVLHILCIYILNHQQNRPQQVIGMVLETGRGIM